MSNGFKFSPRLSHRRTDFTHHFVKLRWTSFEILPLIRHGRRFQILSKGRRIEHFWRNVKLIDFLKLNELRSSAPDLKNATLEQPPVQSALHTQFCCFLKLGDFDLQNLGIQWRPCFSGESREEVVIFLPERSQRCRSYKKQMSMHLFFQPDRPQIRAMFR